MTNKNISAQAARLQKFVDLTGYSVNEFAKQCDIPSTRTLTRILTDGGKPSSKMLSKIIKRFPQLNHDWVVLGYGEMIVKGLQTQETSVNSLKMSNDSVYNQIQTALRDHDYAFNELGKNIIDANKNITKSAEEFKSKLDNLKEYQVQSMALIMAKFESKLHEQDLKIMKDNEAQLKLIDKLDKERKAYMKKSFTNFTEDIKKHGEFLLSKVKEHSDSNTKKAVDLVNTKLTKINLGKPETINPKQK